MASLKELRNRIASVKATQKITKAMQMVAVSKLRRAQVALQFEWVEHQRVAGAGDGLRGDLDESVRAPAGGVGGEHGRGAHRGARPDHQEDRSDDEARDPNR